MDKHCKDCKHHHSAGHKKPTKELKKYNDWCCKMGMPANVGHCKTLKLKEVKEVKIS